MDFKDVVVAMAIGLVAFVGFIGFMTELSNNYGVEVSTIAGQENLILLTNQSEKINKSLISFKEEGKEGIDADSGKGLLSSIDDIGRRAMVLLLLLPTMLFQVIPSVLSASAGAIGLPNYISNLVGTVFVAVALITFAYVLILGIRRLR